MVLMRIASETSPGTKACDTPVYKILRFANPEIDRELDSVMETILSELKSVDPTRLLAARGATLPFGEG